MLPAAGEGADWFSPNALVAGAGGKRLFVTGKTGRGLLVWDGERAKVAGRLALPAAPTGLALAPDGRRLAVTCARPPGVLCLVDVGQGRVVRRAMAGHTPVAPVYAPDGRVLAYADRFRAQVVLADPANGAVQRRIPVPREPISLAFTADGARLLVAHHLPQGPATADRVAATVSVVDVAQGRVVRTIPLPNGSTTVRDIRVSPDGRLAAVVHVLARFQLPTTQLERGWMNTAALTLIDV
ncbi:MAG: hypothetical protein D6766_03135, partial [Verrucomicrobia bacterium]